MDKHLNNFNNRTQLLPNIGSALKNYISTFLNDYTHVALVTFGQRQSTSNYTDRLLTTNEIGKQKFFEKLANLKRAETDSRDVRSALKRAIKLAKSSASSQHSVLLFSTLSTAMMLDEYSHSSSNDVEIFNSEQIPVHAFAFSNTSQLAHQLDVNRARGHIQLYHINNEVSQCQFELFLFSKEKN